MTDMIFYSKNCLNEPHCSLKDVLEKFDKCKGQLQRAEKQLAEDEEMQVDMRIKIDELKGLLSHKEQECETLEKINKNLLNENQDLRRTLNEISQNIIAKERECNELKKINEEKNELLAKLGCPTIATARMKAFTLQQQLDQLKTENEELKKQLTILDDEDVVVEITVKQFEEYKKLKAENKTYKKMLEDEDVQLALTEIRSGERHLWFNKAERYKQALQEIKKITSKMEYGNDFDYDFTWGKQILQKISEVKDE